MTKTNIHARSSLAALAATLALSTTTAFAQEATVPVNAAPADTAVATETTTTAAPEADALGPAPEAEPVVETAAPVKKTTARAPAKPTVTARSSPVTTTAATAAPAAAPIAATPAPSAPEDAPAPLADPAASPMTPEVATPVAAETSNLDEMLPIFGGGALALLTIAGAGVAMRRRRKKDRVAEPETWTEPTIARTAPQPAVASSADRSAFAWGNAAPVAATAPVVVSGDRIAAAYRGPTPDNPFLSMKRRIKRAAFFQQRDRAVREGKASPLSPMAGLPKTLVQRLQSAVPARQTYAFQPA